MPEVGNEGKSAQVVLRILKRAYDNYAQLHSPRYSSLPERGVLKIIYIFFCFSWFLLRQTAQTE
jgi:hypothetical protein